MNRETGNRLIPPRSRQPVGFAPRATHAPGTIGLLPRGAILHPTDYSEASRQAFELACRIARDGGRRLIVMHVPEPVRFSSLGVAPVPPLPKGYRGAWESRLRMMQPRDPSVPVEHRLEEGGVAAAIVRVAREVPCDLIVMSGRERTWPGGLLKGSVVGQVEREAPCPVLRLHTHEISSYRRDDMLDFRTILHPTDFSDPAMYAFGLARALAKESGAELLIAHVAPRRHRPRRRHRRETHEALRRLTTVDSDVRMHPLLMEGDAASRIVISARELDCDLIVMGTRGRTGLSRLLLGSVASAVRRDAPCPVMTVQLPNRDGWELPEFADEKSLVANRRVRPFAEVCRGTTGGQEP